MLLRQSASPDLSSLDYCGRLILGIEFDLDRALFLTYVGVGAAFLVLGSLVVFTGLIGWWGNWRLRRAQERLEEADIEAAEPVKEMAGDSVSSDADPQLAAAIGAAVALALETYRSEHLGDEPSYGEGRERSGGWREQGRIVAFDSRQLRDRQR